MSNQPTRNALTREDMDTLSNLFLINMGNLTFLDGKTKRRPSVAGRSTPILLFLLGLIVVGFMAAVTGNMDSGRGVMGAITAGVALLFLIGVVLSYRAYQNDQQYDTQGKFLQGTITSVEVRERPMVMKVLLGIVGVIAFIITVIEFFDSSNHRHRTYSTYSAGDYYEVKVQYTFTSPNGIQLNSTSRRNRPDLRAGGLPIEGASAIVLYLDDTHFKLM